MVKKEVIEYRLLLITQQYVSSSLSFLIGIKVKIHLKQRYKQVPVLLTCLISVFQTKHVLLVGKGANQFAEEVGIKTVPRESLVSEEAIRELKCYHGEYGSTVDDLFRQRLVW